MHVLVRDLYKRFLVVGKDYPLGLPYVRDKAKTAFVKNAGITSEDELMRAIYKGRWWVNEMIGVIKLKKYRTMKQRYGAGSVVDVPEYHGQDAPSMPTRPPASSPPAASSS